MIGDTLEERAFVAALDNEEARVTYLLGKLTTRELREAISAAFMLAELGQEIERGLAE